MRTVLYWLVWMLVAVTTGIFLVYIAAWALVVALFWLFLGR